MKDFLRYFFGAGSQPEFANFTLQHFIPIALMLGCIILIYRFRDRLRDSKRETAIRYTLALAMIISEMAYYWRLIGVPSLHPNPTDHRLSLLEMNIQLGIFVSNPLQQEFEQKVYIYPMDIPLEISNVLGFTHSQPSSIH